MGSQRSTGSRRHLAEHGSVQTLQRHLSGQLWSNSSDSVQRLTPPWLAPEQVEEDERGTARTWTRWAVHGKNERKRRNGFQLRRALAEEEAASVELRLGDPGFATMERSAPSLRRSWPFPNQG